MKYRNCETQSIVKAIQFTGNNDDEVKEFCHFAISSQHITFPGYHRIECDDSDTILAGDFIIMDEDGNFHGCKSNTFNKIYKLVEE